MKMAMWLDYKLTDIHFNYGFINSIKSCRLNDYYLKKKESHNNRHAYFHYRQICS
jgi:hypothetical protein